LSISNVDDEIALIKLLQAFSQRVGKKLEVYFDNAPPGYSGPRKYGNVKAIFVRTGSTADEMIRRRLSRLGRDAKNWTVVSSDRQVQVEARGTGAKVISSDDFAHALQATEIAAEEKVKPQETISQEELDEWLALFSEEKQK
jgi:uncharacterized protein